MFTKQAIRSFIGIVILILVVGAAPIWSQYTRTWDTVYDSGFIDSLVAVAVDSEHNIFVVGSTLDDPQSGSYSAFTTIKYDQNGSHVWTRTYDGGILDQQHIAMGVVCDSANNVIVTGRIFDETSMNYGTIKYAPDGTLIWVKTYDGPVSMADRATNIALDTSDDSVIVTGLAQLANLGTNMYDIVTIKYLADGTVAWNTNYLRTGGESTYDLGLDSLGNVVVVGQASGNYLVLKLSGIDGSFNWEHTYNGPQNAWDDAYALGFDAADNPIVTGSSNAYASTIKVDGATGVRIWTEEYTNTGESYQGKSLVVDSSDNVYITGRYHVSASGKSGWLTFKYGPGGGSPSGTPLWNTRYTPPYDGGHAIDLGLTDAGSLFVVGWENNANGDRVITTRQYDTDGNWNGFMDTFSSPAGQICEPHQLAIDGDDVVVVGTANRDYGDSDPYDSVVYKLSQDQQTPIELISFEADEIDGVVRLIWSTATEKDNAGFHLLRADTANGQYERITGNMILAEGNEFTGASYEFFDAEVNSGQAYWYKLEDIDYFGLSNFHGPIEITLESEEPQFGCGE